MSLKVAYVFASIGILLAVLSSFLYIHSSEWTSAVGIVSTIISIIMGMISIVYTYISGKETMSTLIEIKKQNKSLVDKINHELSKDNFNDNNIDYIKSTIINE